MTEPSPSAPQKAGPSKKPVSPARNVIGLVVLVAVLVIGYFEYAAKAGYNAAVNALNQRLEDEDHGLPTMPDTEKLIGKTADDAGTEFKEGTSRFTKKTYTWKGLISTYTLAAYYTMGTEPALHHIEAGEKFQPEPAPGPAPAPSGEGKGGMGKGGMGKGGMGKGGMGKGGMGKGGMGKGAAKSEAHEDSKPGADEKKAPEPDDKSKPADEKKAPETKPDDKSKPAAEKKAPETKPDDKSKPATDDKTKPD